MTEHGLFVTIDGIGGAGKTTTARLVTDQLQSQGRTALSTREPSDTALGQFVRDHFSTINGEALACLVTADRLHHLATVVQPHLTAGAVVVCDRYIVSSLVLQPLDGVPHHYVDLLNTPARPPDLAVVLFAEPDTARDRVTHRGSHGRFETNPQQFDDEYAAYQQAALTLPTRGWTIHTIDTTNITSDEAARQIVRRIAALDESIGSKS